MTHEQILASLAPHLTPPQVEINIRVRPQLPRSLYGTIVQGTRSYVFHATRAPHQEVRVSLYRSHTNALVVMPAMHARDLVDAIRSCAIIKKELYAKHTKVDITTVHHSVQRPITRRAQRGPKGGRPLTAQVAPCTE